MAETSEIEALKAIYSEIDESQIKVLVSTQCIKAQSYLVNKLRKKAEQNKERCSFIFTANLKLQSEITHSQQKITSLLIAQDTIKKANVELRKELLLTIEKKLQVIERVENGERKYEDLWLESKARYESLPFVQKLLKAKQEVQSIKQKINELENEEKLIAKEMKIKMEACREIDGKRIVEFAEFMFIERPKNIKLIKEKSAAIKEIADKLKNLDPKTEDKVTKPVDNDPDNREADNNVTSLMPKLQLNYLDFDNLNENLDKIKGDDPFTKTPEKAYSVHSIIMIDPSKVNKKKSPNNEEYISSFFYKPIAKYEPNKTQNYAKMKLINILDDIKIDKKEAERMIADVDPDGLQPVESISVNDVEKNQTETLIKKYPNEAQNVEIGQKETQSIEKHQNEKHYIEENNESLNLENFQAPEDEVITSKFFLEKENQKNTDESVVESMIIEEDQTMTVIEIGASPEQIGNEPDELVANPQTVLDKLPIEDVSTANQKETVLTQAEEEKEGSLYSQGPQMTSDFFEESGNTSVFGDGDGYPSYLDTSLLLSPKADLSIPNLETQEVLSQEMPNFLTGLRKTGISFFGRSSESKPDTSGQNQKQDTSGFRFNFGVEKKSRGGLFSMFQ